MKKFMVILLLSSLTYNVFARKMLDIYGNLVEVQDQAPSSQGRTFSDLKTYGATPSQSDRDEIPMASGRALSGGAKAKVKAKSFQAQYMRQWYVMAELITKNAKPSLTTAQMDIIRTAYKNACRRLGTALDSLDFEKTGRSLSTALQQRFMDQWEEMNDEITSLIRANNLTKSKKRIANITAQMPAIEKAYRKVSYLKQ